MDCAVDALPERYVQVLVTAEQAEQARRLKPFYERKEVFGRYSMFFEGHSPEELAAFGEMRTPSIADLFVSKMQGVPA